MNRPLNKKIELVDTTLRDGGYAVDFQFTAQDTSVVALGLEKLGFRWIEIGHGLGLNASASGKGKAAASDREYVEAASSVLKKARFGTFFIPGIGRQRDLDMARECGMGFVRIGTNASEAYKTKEFIRYSKKLGFLVSVNLMKSYVLPPEKLYKNARMAAALGADIICLVDSAGGMLPEDVEAYFERLAKLKGVRLGFHGHNNLGLAVANTLKAIECGADLVDVSLQGLGRSAGNAPSEILVGILKKKNLLKDDIDLYKTLEFGQKTVSPLFNKPGFDPMSVISGYAKFHSSFTPIVNKYADKYKVDPKELIVDLCAVDQVNAPESVVKELALKLCRKKLSFTPYKIELGEVKLNSRKIGRGVSGSFKKSLGSLSAQLGSFSKKHGKFSVINVVSAGGKKPSISRFIQESPYFMIGTVEAGDKPSAARIFKAIDGKVDCILVDCEAKQKGGLFKTAKDNIKRSRVLAYKDNDSWTRSIFQQLVYLLPDVNKRIAIFGFNNLSVKLAILLAETGFKVILTSKKIDPARASKIVRSVNDTLVAGAAAISFDASDRRASSRADALIGLSPGEAVVGEENVKGMKKNGVILDGSLGSITDPAIKRAASLGIKIIRVDMGPVIAAEVSSGIGIKDLLCKRMGRKNIGGIECVAGGLLGDKGDIVLDSINDPNLVVGIADGRGNVIYDPADGLDRRRMERVADHIALMRIA